MSRAPESSPGGSFLRPMTGWWRRNPVYVAYMVRETTAFGVAIYALVLLAGVVCLARGEAAWNAWLAAMRSPASIALHVVLLVAFACHAWSWFSIMPKTMPMLFVGGRRLAASTITRVGWGVALLAAIALLGLAWMMRP